MIEPLLIPSDLSNSDFSDADEIIKTHTTRHACDFAEAIFFDSPRPDPLVLPHTIFLQPMLFNILNAFGSTNRLSPIAELHESEAIAQGNLSAKTQRKSFSNLLQVKRSHRKSESGTVRSNAASVKSVGRNNNNSNTQRSQKSLPLKPQDNRVNHKTKFGNCFQWLFKCTKCNNV